MSASFSAVAAEKTLFLGPRIPNHVKSLSKTLPTITKPVFRSLVKLAVSDFEGKDITPETYQSIKNEADEATNVDIIYGGLYTLLKCALSIPVTSLKKEVFKGDLKELQIPEDYVEDLVNVVYGPRCSPIRASLMKNAPHLNKLEKLGWRLDVAISTSALSRVLEPTIVMEMTVDGDRKETFEVQPSQFHQLRFAVASLLKEMENLEKKNVLKN